MSIEHPADCACRRCVDWFGQPLGIDLYWAEAHCPLCTSPLSQSIPPLFMRVCLGQALNDNCTYVTQGELHEDKQDPLRFLKMSPLQWNHKDEPKAPPAPLPPEVEARCAALLLEHDRPDIVDILMPLPKRGQGPPYTKADW